MEQWGLPDGRTVCYEVEEGGVVRVAVEMLRQMLTDLGCTRKEDL